MAKEQDMTLTPSKISGVCGRLLCCLQYENEWYHEAKEAMPQVGNAVKTKSVSGVVHEVDLFQSTIKVRSDNGELVKIKLEDLKEREKGRTAQKIKRKPDNQKARKLESRTK